MFRYSYQNRHLTNEVDYCKQLAQSYFNKIQELEKKVDTLTNDYV